MVNGTFLELVNIKPIKYNKPLLFFNPLSAGWNMSEEETMAFTISEEKVMQDSEVLERLLSLKMAMKYLEIDQL